MGIAHLSLFGSVARDEAGVTSDVDLAVTFADPAHTGLFHYAVVSDRLQQALGGPIDLVCEPAAKPRVQAGIDRDRVDVF